MATATPKEVPAAVAVPVAPVAAAFAAVGIVGSGLTAAAPSAVADSPSPMCGYQFRAGAQLNLQRQETGETYNVGSYNTGAFKVVTSQDSNATGLQTWTEVWLADGNVHLVNWQTGDLLQSTDEYVTLSTGYRQYNVVASPAAWNIPQQEWSETPVINAQGQMYMQFVNVETGGTLTLSVNSSYRNNPAWHPVVADNGPTTNVYGDLSTWTKNIPDSGPLCH